MKIAISAQQPNLDAPVDPRFGRAAYFLIVETDDDSFEAIDNATNVDASGGAGTRSAERVAQAGARWVLSGDVGPKAQAALAAGGIQTATGVTGTCRQALADFKANRAGSSAQ